jgi:hypothetical protein
MTLATKIYCSRQYVILTFYVLINCVKQARTPMFMSTITLKSRITNNNITNL